MGSLFDIGEGADAEIKEKLNKRFGGKKLVALQKHWETKEKLFDPSHRLARFCERKQLYPANATSRGKWYYLLIRVLPASAGTVDAIKNLLTKALDKTNGITRVVFEAVEDSATTTHYIHPNNGNPGIRIGNTLNIILVCPAPLGNDVETAPTEPDPGEEEIVETTARKKRSAKKAKKAKKARKANKANKAKKSKTR